MPPIPPPPPPLPIAKSTKPSGSSSVVSKPSPVPPGAFDGLPIDKVRCMRLMAANTSTTDRPFQPCHMFFYGSLMDPEVIQAVLNLAGLPTPKPATISGFQIKMWGIYPALVPSTSGLVTGTVWKVDLEEHFERLAAYETSAYDWVECDATLEDGTVLPGCRTFCWAGRPDSNELEEGHFDLQRYRKTSNHLSLGGGRLYLETTLGLLNGMLLFCLNQDASRITLFKSFNESAQDIHIVSNASCLRPGCFLYRS